MSTSIFNASSFVYNPAQKYLFGRSYALAIGPPGSGGQALQYSNFSPPGTSLAPSPLRIRFDIKKNDIGTPNAAKIEVFNLSENSRQVIKKGFLVSLSVGYNGIVQTLFTGNINVSGLKSVRSGPDIITTMECGDGEAAIVLSKLDKSYPPGTTLVAILQDVAEAMHVSSSIDPDGINFGVVANLPNITYGRGLTISGPCNVTLDTLLKPQGLRWSVQNGNLSILPVGATNNGTAIVVSIETGMIGVPSQNDQYTEFQSLLNPNLVPTALVQLNSQNTAINGFYKILNAHYEGDSHDNKWNVACQCTQALGIQTLNTSAGSDFSSAVSNA